jgi:signal transduction histidine kinase/ActR/RegA family two-component response regulator
MGQWPHAVPDASSSRPIGRTRRLGDGLVEIVAFGETDTAPSTLAEALERLAEAEDTLRAIGAGEVDAFVVSDEHGRAVFTLSTADRLYRIFVEHMRDGAATVSSNGLILYANQRLADLLSCTREDLVGLPFARFVGGTIPLGQNAGETGVGATAEIDLLDGNGNSVPVLVGTTTIEIDHDRLACLTFTDLRGQKGLEEQLQQARKMEAIGSLAGGIAHDFNNMLAVIRGYSSILLQRITDPKSKKAVEQIEEAAARATELTAQLLAFSRQQVLQPEVTDANEVVVTTLNLLERLLGDDIVLEQHLDPELASILVDRGQLGQVVLNLAVNGRDAMVGGGTLTLRTENVELDDDYAAAHRDVVAGRYVLIRVSDSGAGMDEETQGRVFDPFFTTKEHGTGLGLSTVYGIVKQSGGHISVLSELGIGTELKLYFPATDAAILPPAPQIESHSLHGSETILVIEDDQALRVLSGLILASYGYRVLSAASGEEALAIVSDERTPTIDLLLTDVLMPVMNGREVAQQVKAVLPDVCVLFTSGYPADTILRAAIEEGRHAFIQKPYVAAELAKKIRESLGRPKVAL